MTTQKLALLACNMGAMTSAQRQHHDRIAAQLRRATNQVKELPDGYAFRYASDPALFQAAEFITLESRCGSMSPARTMQNPSSSPFSRHNRQRQRYSFQKEKKRAVARLWQFVILPP